MISAMGISRRFGLAQGVAAAAALTALVVGLGSLHVGLPSLSWSSSHVKRLRVSGTPAPIQLRGPSVLSVGSLLTIRGGVPDRDEGPVTVLASIDGGPWRTRAVADGSSGSYAARIGLNQRGVLRLRVVFRDGTEGVQTITVT